VTGILIWEPDVIELNMICADMYVWARSLWPDLLSPWGQMGEVAYMLSTREILNKYIHTYHGVLWGLILVGLESAQADLLK